MDTGIQVPVWNVLKYVVLTLLLAPLAETAMSQVTAWRHAYLVKRGKPIQLKASQWGNIALHQEVETNHVSGRFWQVFSILLALAIALPFEYSSGAKSQIVWSQQESRSSAVGTNGTDEIILLALDNPAGEPECVNPNTLASIGEFVFLKPREDKPPLLDGVVTLEDINNLLSVKYQGQSWQRRSLTSRRGETGLVLYTGGRSGQQAIIGDLERGGLLVADFESGSLCKGLLDDTFSCYDLTDKFTVSQLVHSLAAVRGSSMFLRTRFENAAKLFRFREAVVTISIGNPTVEENLYDQRLNETGFEWLVRHRDEGGSPSLSISTLPLDKRLQSVSCQSVGSSRIRPLHLRVGEEFEGFKFEVNVSAKGDLNLVKTGTKLQTILLTEVGNEWKCAVDWISGVCESATNGSLYFMSKAERTFEFTTEFELKVTQNVESNADLAVLLAQIGTEIRRNGFIAFWDLQNLLSFSPTEVEGARIISTRMDTSVLTSSGIRVTGTIEAWALGLYAGFWLLFISILVVFRLRSWPGIDIERIYRWVVWQRETVFNASVTPRTAPTVRIESTLEDGAVQMRASYFVKDENPMELQQA